ncbi:MAG: hypothetical protein ABIS47_04930 [Acidimicrobiales bacterium]
MSADRLDLPHLDADDLAGLASALLRLPARPGWPDPPFLVALPWGDPWRVDDLGFDLEARPLGSAHALDMLCGERPKPEWVAVGVVVDGWTVPPAATDDVDWRTLHRDGPSLAVHPERRRVRTLHLVGRGGAVALALLGEGDDEPEAHATADGGARDGPTGPLPDGLRRLLGLPTPPCPVPAVELWASLWLAAVVARATRRRATPLGWQAIAALHPGAQLLRQAPGLDPTDHLAVIGRTLARVWGWDALQAAAVAGVDRADFLPPPSVAAWADAGMFARLVLRHLDPLWSSRRHLGGRLSPAALAQVDATLGAWGLDPAPPGEHLGGPRPDHAA